MSEFQKIHLYKFQDYFVVCEDYEKSGPKFGVERGGHLSRTHLPMPRLTWASWWLLSTMSWPSTEKNLGLAGAAVNPIIPSWLVPISLVWFRGTDGEFTRESETHWCSSFFPRGGCLLRSMPPCFHGSFPPHFGMMTFAFAGFNIVTLLTVLS